MNNKFNIYYSYFTIIIFHNNHILFTTVIKLKRINTTNSNTVKNQKQFRFVSFFVGSKKKKETK